MFKVAVAHSLELDSTEAVAEVLEQCREELGILKPQAGLLFTGIDHDFQIILDEINGAYPDIELIGCTTDGEISSVYGYADDSVTFMVFCSDELTFKAGVADNISRETTDTVRNGIDSVLANLELTPALCIAIYGGIIPGGRLQNYDDILDGIEASLGKNFPVFGGGAADQWRLEGTYQFYNNKLFEDSVVFSINIRTGAILLWHRNGAGPSRPRRTGDKI